VQIPLGWREFEGCHLPAFRNNPKRVTARKQLRPLPPGHGQWRGGGDRFEGESGLLAITRR
jgi:hypothetical protein